MLENYKQARSIFLDGKNFEQDPSTLCQDDTQRNVSDAQINFVVDYITKIAVSATKDEIFLMILDNVRITANGYVVNAARIAAENLTYTVRVFRVVKETEAHHIALILYRAMADRSKLRSLSDHRIKQIYPVDGSIDDMITETVYKTQKTKAVILKTMRDHLVDFRGPIKLSKTDIKNLKLTKFEAESWLCEKNFCDITLPTPRIFDIVKQYVLHYSGMYRVEVQMGLYETVTSEMVADGYQHNDIPYMYVYGKGGSRYAFFFSETPMSVPDLIYRGWIVCNVLISDGLDLEKPEISESIMCTFSDFTPAECKAPCETVDCRDERALKIAVISCLRRTYPNIPINGNVTGKCIDTNHENMHENYEYLYVLSAGIDYAGLVITFSKKACAALKLITESECAFCTYINCENNNVCMSVVMRRINDVLTEYFCGNLRENAEKFMEICICGKKKRKRENDNNMHVELPPIKKKRSKKN